MSKKKLKKDFDRDQMYSKIMPSLQGEMEPTAIVAEPGTYASEAPIPAPAIAPDPDYPLLHNYMEDLILEKIDHTMKVLRACACLRCKKDVLALSLNALPPAYAVTMQDQKAERVKKLRRELEVKVTAVLIKSIQQVKASPRH